MPLVMLIPQLLDSTIVLPPVSHPELQTYPPHIQVTLVTPDVFVQDTCYDELKVVMDA